MTVVPRICRPWPEQSFNQTTSSRPHRRHTWAAAQTKSVAQRTYSEKANTHTHIYSLELPVTPLPDDFLSQQIQPHVSKQTVNDNRRTLRKCCRRWRRGNEAEDEGGGAISGTSRATYLYKFMATCAAICRSQLMTGRDTKVMKTLRSDATLVASRGEILHGFCGRRSNKKVLSVDIFYLSVKIVCTVSKKADAEEEIEKAAGGKSEKRNSRTYRENIKQEISRAKICMQVKSRKQDVNVATSVCVCVCVCMGLRCVLRCVLSDNTLTGLRLLPA